MDALTFSRPNTECKIKCPGNDKELCGGAFALTVYMNGTFFNSGLMVNIFRMRKISYKFRSFHTYILVLVLSYPDTISNTEIY